MVALSHDNFRRSKKRVSKAGTPASTREFVAQRLAAISATKPVLQSDTIPHNEQRRIGRRSVYRLASVFTSKLESIRCVVIDLSADGARITMEDAYTLPEIVTLRFEQSCVRKKARIAWRQGRDAGLCFIKQGDAGETENNRVD